MKIVTFIYLCLTLHIFKTHVYYSYVKISYVSAWNPNTDPCCSIYILRVAFPFCAAILSSEDARVHDLPTGFQIIELLQHDRRITATRVLQLQGGATVNRQGRAAHVHGKSHSMQKVEA